MTYSGNSYPCYSWYILNYICGKIWVRLVTILLKEITKYHQSALASLFPHFVFFFTINIQYTCLFVCIPLTLLVSDCCIIWFLIKQSPYSTSFFLFKRAFRILSFFPNDNSYMHVQQAEISLRDIIKPVIESRMHCCQMLVSKLLRQNLNFCQIGQTLWYFSNFILFYSSLRMLWTQV